MGHCALPYFKPAQIRRSVTLLLGMRRPEVLPVETSSDLQTMSKIRKGPFDLSQHHVLFHYTEAFARLGSPFAKFSMI